MTDELPPARWSLLEPSSRQRQQIEARVFEMLDAHETSLFAEWLGLIRQGPFSGLSFATAGAASLLFVSPLSWFARSMLFSL